ncbi:MAG: hypothetical protein J6M25_06695 [Prevotella sp.]|nr:hypothetical protein [Prevotella sp.]
MKKNNCEKWLKISSGARNVMKHVMLGVYAAMGIIYCPYKIMMAVVAALFLLSVLLDIVMKKRCKEMGRK